jgi:hypothetical protein
MSYPYEDDVYGYDDGYGSHGNYEYDKYSDDNEPDHCGFEDSNYNVDHKDGQLEDEGKGVCELQELEDKEDHVHEQGELVYNNDDGMCELKELERMINEEGYEPQQPDFGYEAQEPPSTRTSSNTTGICKNPGNSNLRPWNQANLNMGSNTSSISRAMMYTNSGSSNMSPRSSASLNMSSGATTWIPTMGHTSPEHSNCAGYPSGQNPSTRVWAGTRCHTVKLFHSKHMGFGPFSLHH